MTLEQAEALFVIGRLPGEDLPGLATGLLESGTDSPAMRELAGLSRPTLRDAGVVFERMIRELDRTLPTKEDAAWLLAKSLASSVLEGTISYREAARRGAPLAVALDYAELFMPFYRADDDYEMPFYEESDIDSWLKTYCEALVRG